MIILELLEAPNADRGEWLPVAGALRPNGGREAHEMNQGFSPGEDRGVQSAGAPVASKAISHNRNLINDQALTQDKWTGFPNQIAGGADLY
jgi:hypothetical protein